MRLAESSYLAGPDDIYVAPSQIRRRFSLHTGDEIRGKIHSKNKVNFENLTPLQPYSRMRVEIGNGCTEDLTPRIIDLVFPIGKGQRALLVSPPKAGKTVMLQNIIFWIVI